MDRRKDDVAQSVADFATSLRESTTSFEDRPNIRAFVDSAAEGLDQLADTIRQRSFADIFNEAEDIVRQRPGRGSGRDGRDRLPGCPFHQEFGRGAPPGSCLSGRPASGRPVRERGQLWARARQGSPAPQRGPQGSQSGADI